MISRPSTFVPGGWSLHNMGQGAHFATHSVRKGTTVMRQAPDHNSLATTSICVDLARDVMDRELRENAL
jgi:hypothetical protein